MLHHRRYIGTFFAAAVLAISIGACGGDPTATPVPTPTAMPEGESAAPATPTPVEAAPAPVEAAATPTPAPASGSGQPAPTPTPAPPTPTPAPTATPAFDVNAHFEGQTIRLIVGSQPGGGTDASARWIARGLGEYFPGNPRFVVSNLPSVAAMNAVWGADPDGLMFTELAQGYFPTQLERVANYDLSKVRVIGNTALRTSVMSIANHAPYLTLEEATGASGDPLIHAAELTRYTEFSSSELVFAWVCDKFNIPCRVVPVIDSSTNQELLMLQREEVNSMMHTDVSWYGLPVRNPGLYEDGFLLGFVDLSVPSAPPLTPNIPGGTVPPNIWELLPEGALAEYNTLFGPDQIVSKVFWLPPDTPETIVNTYRQAFKDALQDAEFVEGLNRLLGQQVHETGQFDQAYEDLFHRVAAGAEEYAVTSEAEKLRLYNKYVVQ